MGKVGKFPPPPPPNCRACRLKIEEPEATRSPHDWGLGRISPKLQPQNPNKVVMYAEIWGSWGRHIQVDRRTAGWGRGWARALVGVPAGKAAKWRAKLSEEAGSGVQVVGVVSDALKFWDDYAVCTDQGYWVAQSDAVWASGKKVDGYEVIFVPGEVVDLELDRRQHTLTVRGSKRHVTIANLPASGMLYPALCFVDPKQYAELLDYYPPAEYFPTEEPAEDVEEVDAQLAAGTAASQDRLDPTCLG